ncbi:hypothetical protein RIF29_20629 [Crotalaria pallida]|uniref:Ubiquitin-like protease family profile domain-containing protein n=1 Tax=Crotalaria pallida TaxID=3830 RepID=A0AAN9FA28_CROPI
MVQVTGTSFKVDIRMSSTLVPPMFQRTQSAVNSSPTLDFPPKMYANFILQVFDEEGSDRTNTFSTPNLKLSNLHQDSSGAPKSSKVSSITLEFVTPFSCLLLVFGNWSNYKNFINEQRRRFATSDVVMDLGRNIFPSPTSKQQTPLTQSKRRGAGEISTNSTPNQPATSASKGKGLATASTEIKQNIRTKSVTIPRALKTMFKPPADIHLTLTEAMLFAFIFGVDMDLCVTLTQKYYSCVTTWHLPPSFAIYVPLREGKHWFFMVISLLDRTVYHVDSYLRDQDMKGRRLLIRDVMVSVSDMITSDAFGDSTESAPRDLEKWPIEIARGVPNMGTR